MAVNASKYCSYDAEVITSEWPAEGTQTRCRGAPETVVGGTRRHHMPVAFVGSTCSDDPESTSRCMHLHLPAGSAPLLALAVPLVLRRRRRVRTVQYSGAHGFPAMPRAAVDGSPSFRQADRSVSLQATVYSIWFGPASCCSRRDAWDGDAWSVSSGPQTDHHCRTYSFGHCGLFKPVLHSMLLSKLKAEAVLSGLASI
jgi:hypothetical protein